MNSILTILASVVIFQLMLMSIFLLTIRKGKKISNLLLASLFLFLLINLIDGMLSFSGFYVDHAAWAHLEDGLIFLLGPILYFYTCSLVYKDFKFKGNDAIHLIPFVAITIAYQFYYHTQTEAFRHDIQLAITKQELPPGFYFSITLIYIHVAAYLFGALRKLRSYRAMLRKVYSDLGKINLEWLSYMLVAMAVVVILSLVTTFLPAFGFAHYATNLFLFSLIFVCVFSTSVLWRSMRQPELFAGFEMKSAVEKYQTSKLSQPQKGNIQRSLVDLMEREKPFLESGLTIDSLADKLGTHSRSLSQVINEGFNQNFFDFINSYRIEEAKRILAESDDSKLTVLEVMYHCGFNSKSSFNTLFKEKTGLTPSAFRKDSNNVSQSFSK